MTISASKFYALDREGCEALETEFYARLKMRNGTFKLTRPARFREVEEAFAPEIAARSSRLRQVLDVGVSTGITSLDLARFLEEAGVDADITATDLYIDAQIVDIAPGVRVLADAAGWPLQYDVLGVAIRPWTRRLDYVTLAALPLAAARALALRLVPRAVAAGRTRPVRMVTRRAEPAGRIRFVENDIFAGTPAFVGRFDLVRAANILNRNYFDEPALVRAIANLKTYARGPGALFWVARTEEDGRNTASLFELGPDGRFTVVARVGGGSEVEALVLAAA
ncbi:ATP-binding protein [Prosthecomicrobium sp. N25]|uniref:ATP-binding protein n=1 Tax=Prosthecomicrobium sp. N25 TaxID=3129254 RepID=UPI003076C442